MAHLVGELLFAGVPHDRQDLEQGEDKLLVAHEGREVGEEGMEVVERDVADPLEAMGAADEEVLELGRDGRRDGMGDGLSLELAFVARDDLIDQDEIGKIVSHPGLKGTK
jgi:hypothetical protein